MADLARIIARMQGQIAELQRRQNNTVRTGRVENGSAKVCHGSGGIVLLRAE